MKHNWSSLSLVLPSSSKTFRVQNQSNNSSKYPRLHKILLTGYCCLIIVTIEKIFYVTLKNSKLNIFLYIWTKYPENISLASHETYIYDSLSLKCYKSPLFVQIYKFHAYKKHPNGKDHINNMHSVVVYTPTHTQK